MSSVFVSYSRVNKEIVSNIVRVLRLLNMELWLDTLGKSHGIPNSTKWFSVIEDALYRASGAVIFVSSAWEISKPCQEEFKLICQNHIPFIKIDLSIEQSINQIANRINKWNGEVINTKENCIRTELFTNIKNHQKDKGAFRNIPTYSKLRQYLIYASAEYKNDGESDAISKINEYLLMAYKHKLKKNLLRLGGLVIAAILFILIQVDLAAFLSLRNAENKYLSASSGAIPIAKVMHVNPYSTMDRLISETSVGNQAEFMNCTNLMVLNNLHLPIDYIKNGNMDTEKYLKIAQISGGHESSDYSFLSNKTAGMVMLSDSKHQVSKQIVVDGIIDAYCWNENGEAVAFAVAEKAYVYDIASSNSYPVILDGNFEDIGSIGWDGNRVFAITTFGNIIIWENPVLRPTNNRDLTKGKMFFDAGGNLCTVYISDDNLIFSKLQNEEIIPLEVKGQIDEDFIAVSHNGTQVAVTYTPTNQLEDRILIVDLDTNRVTADYTLNCVSMEFVFSKDDKSILAACFDLKGVAKLDLTDGQVAFSQSVQEQYYSIALWEDEYIVSTIHGALVLYDENLNVLGNGLFISGTNGNAPRNLVVSEKFGFAFYTHSSGNNLFYNRRVTLSNHSLTIMMTIPTNDTEANSCVSVSEDGDFVAFGYPNGQIWVYDVKNLTTLWCSDAIQERTIYLILSSDNEQIFALGKSGTIYTFNTEGMILPARTDEAVTSHWQRLVEEAAAKNELAYNIGISNIPPQQFGLTTDNKK